MSDEPLTAERVRDAVASFQEIEKEFRAAAGAGCNDVECLIELEAEWLRLVKIVATLKRELAEVKAENGTLKMSLEYFCDKHGTRKK